MLRHELMDFMFADPAMLDDLDYLFKSDLARSLLFYYQVLTLIPYPLGGGASPFILGGGEDPHRDPRMDKNRGK